MTIYEVLEVVLVTVLAVAATVAIYLGLLNWIGTLCTIRAVDPMCGSTAIACTTDGQLATTHSPNCVTLGRESWANFATALRNRQHSP